MRLRSIINLSNYGSKSYASVVLGDHRVIFLAIGKDGVFFIDYIA